MGRSALANVHNGGTSRLRQRLGLCLFSIAAVLSTSREVKADLLVPSIALDAGNADLASCSTEAADSFQPNPISNLNSNAAFCEHLKPGIAVMVLANTGIANERVWTSWIRRAREWAILNCVAPPTIVVHLNSPTIERSPPTWVDLWVPSQNCSWGYLMPCEHALLKGTYDFRRSNAPEFSMLVSDTSIPVKSYAHMHRLLYGDVDDDIERKGGRGQSFFSITSGKFNRVVMSEATIRAEWLKHYQWMILSARDLEYLASNGRQWFSPEIEIGDVSNAGEEFFGCGAERPLNLSKIEAAGGMVKEDADALQRRRYRRFSNDLTAMNSTRSECDFVRGNPYRNEELGEQQQMGLCKDKGVTFFYAKDVIVDPDADPESEPQVVAALAASDEICPLRGLRRFWRETGGTDLLSTFGPDKPQHFADIFEPFVAGLDRQTDMAFTSPSNEDEQPTQRTYRQVLQEDLGIDMDAHVYMYLHDQTQIDPNYHLSSWGNCNLVGESCPGTRKHPCCTEKPNEPFLTIALETPSTFFVRKIANLATINLASAEVSNDANFGNIMALLRSRQNHSSFREAVGDSYLALLAVKALEDVQAIGDGESEVSASAVNATQAEAGAHLPGASLGWEGSMALDAFIDMYWDLTQDR